MRSDLPLAAYLRSSRATKHTRGNGDAGVGLDAQRTAIENYATLHGYTVGSWHTDDGQSGVRTPANRPGLSAVLAAIKLGEAGGLIVAKVDRLGRSTHDVSGLVERAQREGWRLVALDVGLDTATPAGEMVAMALMMAARFEWHRISERQREKHHELRRQGLPRGRPSVPPELADRLRAERDAGASLAQIGARLDSEGVPTAQGGVRWYPATVRSALLARERELAAQVTA